MKRPQFRLSTLLWITLAVACWFGGMAVQRRLDQPTIQRGGYVGRSWGKTFFEKMTMPDGSEWERHIIVTDEPKAK
jgi:hypothetical protein